MQWCRYCPWWWHVHASCVTLMLLPTIVPACAQQAINKVPGAQPFTDGDADALSTFCDEVGMVLKRRSIEMALTKVRLLCTLAATPCTPVEAALTLMSFVDDARL